MTKTINLPRSSSSPTSTHLIEKGGCKWAKPSNGGQEHEVTNFKIDVNNRGEILSTEGERHNPVDPKHKGPEIKNGDLVAVSDMSVSIHKKIFEGKTSTKPKFEIFGKLKPILNIKTNEFERDN